MGGDLRQGSSMNATERRSTPCPVELRGPGDGNPVLGGYALKFNTLSQNLGGFVETIDPNALSKSLGDDVDVLARFQHDDLYLLGRTSSDTLRLSPDNIGLDYEVDLNRDDSDAMRVAAMAKRGDVRHSSFAFRAMDDDWSETEQGFPLRVLRSIQLVDVAPVVSPAYLDTSSGLRSLAERRGLDIDEVLAAAAAESLAELLRGKQPSHIDLAPSGADATGGQGETHPLIAVRQRRAVLMRRNP